MIANSNKAPENTSLVLDTRTPPNQPPYYIIFFLFMINNPNQKTTIKRTSSVVHRKRPPFSPLTRACNNTGLSVMADDHLLLSQKCIELFLFGCNNFINSRCFQFLQIFRNHLIWINCARCHTRLELFVHVVDRSNFIFDRLAVERKAQCWRLHTFGVKLFELLPFLWIFIIPEEVQELVTQLPLCTWIVGTTVGIYTIRESNDIILSVFFT